MSRLAKLIECIVERHKGVRRLALVWAMALITWAVVRTFASDTPNIGGATATALGIVVGILTVVVGFYQWSRDREDRGGGE